MKRKLSLILSSIAILGGVGITAPLIVSCSKETLPEKPTNVIMFIPDVPRNAGSSHFGFMEKKYWNTLKEQNGGIWIDSKNTLEFFNENKNIVNKGKCSFTYTTGDKYNFFNGGKEISNIIKKNNYEVDYIAWGYYNTYQKFDLKVLKKVL